MDNRSVVMIRSKKKPKFFFYVSFNQRDCNARVFFEISTKETKWYCGIFLRLSLWIEGIFEFVEFSLMQEVKSDIIADPTIQLEVEFCLDKLNSETLACMHSYNASRHENVCLSGKFMHFFSCSSVVDNVGTSAKAWLKDFIIIPSCTIPLHAFTLADLLIDAR